jgi:hypothetical protein
MPPSGSKVSRRGGGNINFGVYYLTHFITPLHSFEQQGVLMKSGVCRTNSCGGSSIDARLYKTRIKPVI